MFNSDLIQLAVTVTPGSGLPLPTKSRHCVTSSVCVPAGLRHLPRARSPWWQEEARCQGYRLRKAQEPGEMAFRFENRGSGYRSILLSRKPQMTTKMAFERSGLPPRFSFKWLLATH